MNAIVWQDVECGSYTADLGVWAELAAGSGGPVLDLGAGTGRVALDLARRGHRVVGLDRDPALTAELGRRASSEGLEVAAVTGDAAEFSIGRRFPLILAPMQLIQLLDGAAGRAACLGCCLRHLEPGGRFALAIAERIAPGSPPEPPLPDVREVDGWVYSSLPLAVTETNGALVVSRLRQSVSPDGRLTEESAEVRLHSLGAAELERQARDAGFRILERLTIDPTDAHVGSTVVALRG